MKLKTKDGFMNIEIILNWEDWTRLENGKMIETRYDGEHKIYIHRNPEFCRDNAESIEKSLKLKDYAIWDRTSSDIDVYIAHFVLKDVRYRASCFSKELGNLEIKPDSESLDKFIRIEFPGSLKVIDIPTLYYED